MGELKEIAQVILNELPIDIYTKDDFEYNTDHFTLKMFYDPEQKEYKVQVSKRNSKKIIFSTSKFIRDHFQYIEANKNIERMSDFMMNIDPEIETIMAITEIVNYYISENKHNMVFINESVSELIEEHSKNEFDTMIFKRYDKLYVKACDIEIEVKDGYGTDQLIKDIYNHRNCWMKYKIHALSETPEAKYNYRKTLYIKAGEKKCLKNI